MLTIVRVVILRIILLINYNLRDIISFDKLKIINLLHFNLKIYDEF
jgi:hypothetical protein